MSELKKEFISERQGKTVIAYSGLLDYAHQEGVVSIKTELLQSPNENNNFTAICFATVTMPEGKTFTGIGDANLANVGKMIAVHIIRMAETRAKARALRDALNIAAVALEEFGDEDEQTANTQNNRANRATSHAQPAKAQGLAVVQGGQKTGWQQLLDKCAEFQYPTNEDAVFALAEEILKDSETSNLSDDEFFALAAAENAIAWETAIQAVAAKRQENSKQAVAR